jgi:methylated-DNA-[protein]-cysteine S-methyltransferase
MTARWWKQETPIGQLTIVVGDHGVIEIGLPNSSIDVGAAEPEPERAVARELDEYFAGRRRAFTVPIDLSGVGSPFRRSVLETLWRDVAHGETVSYGELAGMAGRPGAARAVGTTMATNPVPIIVPCHRVVASGHTIGGYGGGLDMKRALLALEGVGFEGLRLAGIGA